jgi:ABC-type glutathione transport system ATPase component
MRNLLEVRGLTVELPTPAGWVRPVNDVSLHIAAGESLGLVGESGSGKTMLALALMGLLPPGARVSGRALLALILQPKLVVADEPVSSLDVSVGAQVLLLLQDLQREFGLTYIFISHSLPVVAQLATRIAVMRAGKFVEVGAAEQILRQPGHSYTRELLAAVLELLQA